MRIIPFTLRITHYSRAPASWPGRPKIHVAGYAPLDTPAGIMSESEDRRRRFRGTVEMTASGDVRWTIVRHVYRSFHHHHHHRHLLVIFSRGRTGSVVHRRRTDRRARLSHGCDRYVDQRRTRIIRPTRCVVTSHTYLSTPHTHYCFRSILGMESWPVE
jgi:hypothetical protein